MDRNTPPGNPWRDLESFVDVRTGLLWARVVVGKGATHSAARTGRPHARCRQTPHRQQSRIPGTRPGHSLPRASLAFPPCEGRSPPSPHLSTPDAFIFCFIVCMLRCVPLFATPGTVTHRLLCPWRFSRQEYWSGWPFPSPADLSNLGIKLTSSALAGGLFTSEPPVIHLQTHICTKTQRQGGCALVLETPQSRRKIIWTTPVCFPSVSSPNLTGLPWWLRR